MAFEQAVSFVNSLNESNTNMTQAQLLEIYGLYKAATVSVEPNTSRPSFFDMRGRAKWDAWKACPAKTPGDAKERYMDMARLFGWKEGETEIAADAAAGPSKPAPTWASVSTMSLDAEDDATSSALHAAVADGDRTAVVALLDEAPERIDEQDSSGNTPLHIAADRGRSDIAHILLDRGANRQCKDQDGQTPLDAAKLAEQSEMVTLLSR